MANDSDVSDTMSTGHGITDPIALGSGEDITDVDCGVAAVPPAEPSTVVAEDDLYGIDLGFLQMGYNAANQRFEFNFDYAVNPVNDKLGVLGNDYDPEGDDFSITRIGTDTTVDADGNFGPVGGSNFGQVVLNEDGTFVFSISEAEFQGLFGSGMEMGLFETSFEYEILDDSGQSDAIDTATISVLVENFGGMDGDGGDLFG